MRMVLDTVRKCAKVNELSCLRNVCKKPGMAPPVLCMLLMCVLQLCSYQQAYAAGTTNQRGGLHNVEINVVNGRKLFDEAAPTDTAAAEPAPSPKPSPKPASNKPPPTPSNSVKSNTPAANKVPPPPTPWYLGGSSQQDSTFAGFSYAFPQDMLNFTDADAYCKKNYKNGHLVSIHSQAQQDFLNKKFVQGTAVTFLPVQVPSEYPTKDGVGHRGVWIGLRTRDTSIGNQGWTDGTPYDFDAFLVGKPDNWRNIEACTQIYGDSSPLGWSGFWDDISCESKMRFICAWPVASNNSYPVYDGNEYIYHSEIASWDDAESTCWKLDNGHLVSIHSAAQSAWIWKVFVFPKKVTDFAVSLPTAYSTNPDGTSHRGIWIGLNLQLGIPYWTDFSNTKFKDWAPSEPDNWNNIEFCTSLYVDAAPKNYAGKWDDLACEAELPFLCSRPVDAKDQVYPQYGGWEYIMLNDAMTWMDANATCVSKFDAQMVSFDSQEELNFVYKQYFSVNSNNYPVLLPEMYTDPANLAAVNQSYVGIGRRGVWIGLILQDGEWGWSDNSKSDFTAWIPGKPDNFMNAETCTQLYIDSTPTGWASYWDDLSCQALCSAICKRKPITEAVQAPNSGSPDPYANETLANIDVDPIVGDALTGTAQLNNTAPGEGGSKTMSRRSVIALAAVGAFIGLLIILSALWRFMRPATPDEEDPATTVATTAAIPTQYKGKAKATGVVHAPTGAGRVPPLKAAAVKEPRPSKYVKIDVDDLEVPLDLPEEDTKAQPAAPVSPQPQVEMQAPVTSPQARVMSPQAQYHAAYAPQYSPPPQYPPSTYQSPYAPQPQYQPQPQQPSFAFPPYTAALPEPRHELMRRQ